MKRQDRRAVIMAYKERKPPAGVYAVRCAATGQCWIGSARDLAAIHNRLWFTLRRGSHPNHGLQEAWRRHGEDGFTFERLETFDADQKDYERDGALKERLQVWKAELKAEAV